jgi:hypothetical protein
MVFEGLYSKTTTARMTLNAANIALALGKEDRLHFVLKVVKIQLYVLCEENTGAEQREKTEELNTRSQSDVGIHSVASIFLVWNINTYF